MHIQTGDAHADKLQVVLWQSDIACGQPSSSGRGKGFFVFRKGRLRRVFVIARHAINGRLDLPDEIKRLTDKGALFDEIAGETDKIGRKVVDRLHDVRRKMRVALVVKIRKMNKARAIAAMQLEILYAQQRWLDPFRIDPRSCGQCEETETEKFSPTDHICRCSCRRHRRQNQGLLKQA